MPRAFGDHVTQQRPPQQRQVPDQVQRLMPAALIGRPQPAGVHHAGVGEADGVLERRPANQAHVAHLVQIGFPTEGAGESDLASKTLGSHFEFQRLPPNGCRVVRIAGQTEAFVGENSDALAFVFHRNGTADTQVAALAAILAGTGLLDQAHERKAAAIQDGNFQVVDLDEGVVDAHRIKNAEQVLDGGDEDALAHQAGSVADAGHVTPTGGNLEIVEIGADENDAGRNRSGKNSDLDRHAAVQPYPRGFDRALQRSLKTQGNTPQSDPASLPSHYRSNWASLVQSFDVKGLGKVTVWL